MISIFAKNTYYVLIILQSSLNNSWWQLFGNEFSIIYGECVYCQFVITQTSDKGFCRPSCNFFVPYKYTLLADNVNSLLLFYALIEVTIY